MYSLLTSFPYFFYIVSNKNQKTHESNPLTFRINDYITLINIIVLHLFVIFIFTNKANV